VSDDLVMGVDGGKSKTVCLIADAGGDILGAGRAGSSDRYDVPLNGALDAVAESARAAAEQAGVPLPVAAGCFGLAGADWPEDFEELAAGLATRNLAGRVLVKNDMHIALHANADYGVVVSGGTHCAAAIRTPDGDEWHAGWFAVEGPGGVTIGRRLLWAVFHAFDGRGEPTALTDLVLEATGKQHPADVLRELSAGRIGDSDFARLAPLVFRAHVQHGDAVAARIITRAGEEMARWATGLLARFDLLDEPMPVILCGGLFRGEGSLLLETVSAAIHTRAPHAILQSATREPVIGALVYAYEALDRAVTPGLISALVNTAPGPEFFETK
jgi:N-acetylglucosamine kinase-like BadF-type ATPase